MNEENQYNYGPMGDYGLQQQTTLSSYMAKTFGWMFLGLLTTFAVGAGLCVSYMVDGLPGFFYSAAFPPILFIAEIVVVMILSARLHKLSVGAATALFFVYAVLNGITFSVLFMVYDIMSMVLVFAMAALYFGGMALYGYITKSDLSRFKPLLFGGLIVLTLFWLLSIFLDLSGLETVMCILGVAVFMGYTAFDVQRIKAFHAATGYDEGMAKKLSVYGALQLYLDFINLFLYLLRLFGRSRD